MEQCEPFLFRQIDTIKPKVIVALGKFAAQCLLQDHRADHAAPRPRVHVPRRDPDADVPPGVPAAEPVGQARGVGGHEARARAADGEKSRASSTSAIASLLDRARSSPSPFPFRFLDRADLPRSRVTCRLPPVGARVRVPVGTRDADRLRRGPRCRAADAGVDAQGHRRGARRRAVPAAGGRRAVPVGGRLLPGRHRRRDRRGDAARAPQARASAFKTRRVVAATAHGLESGRPAAKLGSDVAGADRQAARGAGRARRAPRRPARVGAARARRHGRRARPAGGARAGRDPRRSATSAIRSSARRCAATCRDADAPADRRAGGRLRPLAALADAGEFRVALLHGVTGSGKTEIYLRLAERVRSRGRQVLLLVPEIALTPSVAALFRGAFGDRVAIQHSALSDGERHDQWQRIRRGDVDVVVGTRSAVFAPLDRLGPDHRGRGARHAPTSRRRRRAITAATSPSCAPAARARWSCSGSATPSMETLPERRVRQVRARRRSSGACSIGRWPRVRIVNMREEYAEEGPDVVISRAARRRDRASGWRGRSRCWCC